jgi:hypothetical protein
MGEKGRHWRGERHDQPSGDKDGGEGDQDPSRTLDVVVQNRAPPKKRDCKKKQTS